MYPYGSFEGIHPDGSGLFRDPMVSMKFLVALCGRWKLVVRIIFKLRDDKVYNVNILDEMIANMATV